MAKAIFWKKNSNTIRYSTEDKIFFTVAVIVFTIILLICAYPFYYLLIASVSDTHLVDTGKVLFYPKGFTLDNYAKVFKMDTLARSAGVSLVRTLLGTLLTVMCNTYMAYFFAKENMWGRKFWYRLVIITMYFSAGLIPGYLKTKGTDLVC